MSSTRLVLALACLATLATAHFGLHGPHRVRHGHGHGGGGFCDHPMHLGRAIGQLSPEQRQQLHEIFQKNENATKAEINQALTTFVGTLSTEMQNSIKQGQEKHKEYCAKVEEKRSENLKNVSSEAQTLFNNIQQVRKNDSISLRGECEKIKGMLAEARHGTVDELIQHHLHVREVFRPNCDRPHHRRPPPFIGGGGRSRGGPRGGFGFPSHPQ